MKIVIPMSGSGERFRRAGYAEPKPLIPVDERPMIEHVIGMFPGEEDFVFICNREHLQSTSLPSVLRRAKPSGKIVAIDPHKRGPVHAVCQALGELDDEEEVIVNYCDFSVYWSYADFLTAVRSRTADGAIPSYRGFHPHSLGDTYYGYLRHQDNWMLEIREKQCFTDNRMNEFASAGTYYFRRGALVKKYFPLAIERNLQVNGEYYASLPFNLMQKDGYRVYIHELEQFLQWGTPEDLRDYQYWSNYFRGMALKAGKRSQIPAADYNLVLLAGRGLRFADAGYRLPKPMISVAGAPMILRAIRSLPGAKRWGFVCLKEHLDRYPIVDLLRTEVGQCDLKAIDQVTEGQACTALLAEDLIEGRGSLLIAACDNGMTWDAAAYEQLLADPAIDIIVWVFRGHPAQRRNPKGFGWVKEEGRLVKEVSVKIPISGNPAKDPAIVGTFFFRRGSDFTNSVRAMIAADSRINGEFYIDQAINFAIAAGKRAVVFEVDKYLGWGTPNDLRTFEYWHRYFQKTKSVCREGVS